MNEETQVLLSNVPKVTPVPSDRVLIGERSALSPAHATVSVLSSLTETYTELQLLYLGHTLLDCILPEGRIYSNSSLHAHSTHTRYSTNNFRKSE